MKIYDSDIRKLLYKGFTNKNEFTSDLSTIFINEMDILFGASRIDIAVINGKIHGYEIKSERDNLERLPSQVEYYNKVFDTMTIVVGENHLSEVFKVIPNWWGVYYVSKEETDPCLIKLRDSSENNNTDILSQAQLLWRKELLELLNVNNITKGTKSKNRFALCNLVINHISEIDIKQFIMQKLKSRVDWSAVPLQQLCDDLR